MHESARRGLVRLLAGVGVLAAAILLVVLVSRGCKSEEERIWDRVDDARDALTDKDREAFLSFFAPDVHYQRSGDFTSLGRDLDRWIQLRVMRVTIVDRKLEVSGDTAKIRLRCDVGNVLQSYTQVDVDLDAEKREGEWQVVHFSWKQ